MIYLSGNNSIWWIIGLIAIFGAIGVIVFVLRKKIPGLVNYEQQNEEEIAEDNLSRILVNVEEEKPKEEINEEDN